jgi:hypothetical protein
MKNCSIALNTFAFSDATLLYYRAVNLAYCCERMLSFTYNPIVPDGFGISDVDMIIYLPKPKFYFFYDF